MARFQFKSRKNNGFIFLISFMVMGEATIAAPLPQWANAPAVTPVARLSLQESILRAFARNPDVTQQAAQIGIGEAQIDEAESAWYPHVGLTLSGALPFVQKQKNGLNYMIQEGGFGLSGGQRQTLLLARLLISQPNIVLLDEPSASLDEMAEAYLIEQLKQWIGHRTLVIATHRTAMLQLVDRIIVMDQGRIVMDGAKETILREQGEPTTRRVVLQEKNKGSAA
ncbi:type I secretion system%2C ATP-binding protein [Escherichia coli]|nr:type I secretion system%2C ATP-binding protein [Escherichia coli]